MNGQNKRMTKFEVNGQILKFSKTANDDVHLVKRHAIHQIAKIPIGEWPAELIKNWP